MAMKKTATAADDLEELSTAMEVDAVEAKREQENDVKPVGNADGFCAYLGPSILGVIQSGSIFKGSREEVLETLRPARAQYPLIAALLVPSATLAADRIKVKTPGNLLFENYKKLALGKR